MNKGIRVVALMACLGPPIEAQAVARWETDGCADSRVPAKVDRCGLFLAENELLRGFLMTVVSMAEPLRPIQLSRFVRSDTARMYAARYERQARVAGLLRFAG